MESSEIIGHDEDVGAIFFIKQESMGLSEEDFEIFNDDNNTSLLLSKSSTCILCHVNYHHDDELKAKNDEGINQARTTFFNQQIYQQQYKSSMPHSMRLNLVTTDVTDLQTNIFFCHSCATKLDHLHSLHNTLMRLQEEFDQLKSKLVAKFKQGEGQGQVVSSKKSSDLTVVKNGSRRSLRKTKSLAKYKESASDPEFENDDDDDAGSDYVIGNTENPSSDSDNNEPEESPTINVKQMKSCRVVVNRLNSATTNNIKPQQRQQHKVIKSSKQTTFIKTYPCTICHKTFTKSTNLCRHNRLIHNQERNYKCEVCSKGFNRRDQLTTHLKVLHHQGGGEKVGKGSNKLKQCHICSKTFNRPSHLDVHLRTHSGLRPFQCSNCPKAFYTSNDLKTHSIVHSSVKNHVCEVCSRGFSRRHKLKAHLHRAHGLAPDQTLLCSKCSSGIFLNRTQLEQHEETCTGDDKGKLTNEETRSTEEIQRLNAQALIDARTCPDCGLVFDKIVSLKIHCRKEFHGEARKNQCEFCGQSFTHKDTLKNHFKRVHQNIKGFRCVHCPESFTRKRELLRHTQIHTGKAEFSCTYCEASFNYVQNLRKHSVESHSEEYLVMANKPFVCKVCWQNFELESQLEIHQSSAHSKCHVCNKLLRGAVKLQVHLYTHTGEKPFTCQHCGKGFNHSFNLAEHERTHTGEKRYKCTGCERGFIRKKYLETHMQKVHSGLWSAQLEEAKERNTPRKACQLTSLSGSSF